MAVDGLNSESSGAESFAKLRLKSVFFDNDLTSIKIKKDGLP